MKPHVTGIREGASFASAWAGGDEATYLVEVETFAKTLKVRREPEDEQLAFLAGAQMKRASISKWQIACLKALLQAADEGGR